MSGGGRRKGVSSCKKHPRNGVELSLNVSPYKGSVNTLPVRWGSRCRTALVAAAVFIAVLSAAAGHGWAASVTFLHFSDSDELTPVDAQLGGYDRLATLVQRMREEHGPSLLVFSGDLISPSLASSVFLGAQMIAGLEALGVDYAALGNHEFDFGADVLKVRLAESSFPWIATNVFENGRPFPGTMPYALVDVGEVKVGLLGLLTPDTHQLAPVPDSVLIADPIAVAKHMAPMLKALGADIVVALTHLPLADDRALMQEVPAIDVVLGGHDHLRILEQHDDGRILAKAGADARYLGVTRLEVEGGRIVAAASDTVPVDPSLEPDPHMVRLMGSFAAHLDDELDRVIGETAVPLDARTHIVRAQETVLGNLAADAIREFAGADVAIVNGGGIRTGALFAPGPIRRRDVAAWFPFRNTVVVLEATGEQIVQALENGVSQVERFAGRFPQVSGLRFAYDPSQPAGSRIVWVEVNGQPLDLHATYRLAATDYLLGGGDGYDVLRGTRVLIGPTSGRLLTEVVAAHIERHSPVNGQLESRIVVEPVDCERVAALPVYALGGTRGLCL